VLSAIATVEAGPPAQAAASHLAKLSPPVIREQFTPLPCPRRPQSTLELEGCAERRIVSTDRQIDGVLGAIFPLLFDDAARRRLIDAQHAWLAFRKADCTSVSDKYEGGTLAGLLAASCTADRSARRLKDLRAFERLLRHP
jgi:uncharacterized protein YecT (DUF1311 family)